MLSQGLCDTPTASKLPIAELPLAVVNPRWPVLLDGGPEGTVEVTGTVASVWVWRKWEVRLPPG